jgi:hypothetical protein
MEIPISPPTGNAATAAAQRASILTGRKSCSGSTLPSATCGLVHGDIGADVVEAASKIGALALDVQCMLRCVQPDHHMIMRDWAEKRELLPLVSFLKTDAAEAEVMTGSADRTPPRKTTACLGRKEVMIRITAKCSFTTGAVLYRSAQSEKSQRTHRRGHHLCLLSRRTAAQRNPRIAPARSGPCFAENGNARPLPWRTRGYAGVLDEFYPTRKSFPRSAAPRGQPARLPLKQQRLFFNPLSQTFAFSFPVLVTFAGTNPAYQ